MAAGELIPPDVDEHDAALLRRAYTLTSREEGDALYREWAESYDRTMLDGLGYLAPRRLSELFARHARGGDRPVLDLGCGTGLVGVELAGLGFTTIDGLDLSAEMIAVAERRHLYRSFVVADLERPLPIPDAAYDAAICNGTFTEGHVGAGCLDEIARVVAVGGIFACAVRDSIWETFGFAAAFDRLAADGTFEPVEIVASAYYATSSATDGRLCVLRRC